VKRLLCKRRQPTYALNISIAQVRRVEDVGLLETARPVRQFSHHRVDQTKALANGER
jgi:hypothetical protein